ncbi:MAG: hypothetical protein ABIN94_01120 [Ferruginibacter sp.]
MSQKNKNRLAQVNAIIEEYQKMDLVLTLRRQVTERYHVPILVNRGYSSVSAMFESYRRFLKAHNAGQAVRILYLGDYDPSGIDMIRDIHDRITEFAAAQIDDFDFSITPIALTAEQIQQYRPPANPAKVADPRAKHFIEANGSSSWEVDALRPEVLTQLLDDAILGIIDIDKYQNIVETEDDDKTKLKTLLQYI